MMREIKAIIRPDRLPAVLRALHAVPDLPGVTMSTVTGFGRILSDTGDQEFDEVEMAKLEIVVPTAMARDVAMVIGRASHTGRGGDGRIFIIPVEHALKVRSGEWDPSAV